MLPFAISLRTGEPIFEQVVYAVSKAVVNGQLRSGDAFPSVRSLSRELKINPNTAHRIVAALIEDGLLTVHPGVGTVVAKPPTAPDRARLVHLEDAVERLVVDARRAGMGLQDVLAAIRRRWARTVSRAG
jgi:GntR family transcriptional regulator